MSLRVTMLGSGTSTGIPVIGCPCRVCNSENPRNKRWRPGLKLEMDGGVVLVDIPTDLRAQALRFGLPRVDAIVYTHSHADHIFGLDDVRIFNFRQGSAIPCYGSAETLRAIRRTFAYVFEPGQEGGGKPRLALIGGGEAVGGRGGGAGAVRGAGAAAHPDSGLAWRDGGLRLPDRRFRLRDRLQPDPRDQLPS